MNFMKSVVKVTIPVSIFLLVLVISCPLSAKEWPSETITMMQGMAAGGSSDIASRYVMDSISKALGVPVVVEHKTGASGHLALSAVSKAKPDGYTIGFMPTTAITAKPFFVKDLPFDPTNGFTYLASIFRYTNGWVVRSDSKWKTIHEFLDNAKKERGKLTVAMTGTSSNPQIALGKIEFRIPALKGAISIVPFKGGMPAMTALLGGHVDSTFTTGEWKPFVKSGQLRLLLLLDKSKEFPGVLSFEELGYGKNPAAAGCIIAPPGLPETIREKFEQAIKKAIEEPSYEEKCMKPFAMDAYFKPGKEFYKELMELKEENSAIIPKLGLSEE
jgi:tripartite-type tricarboxylate transporter receptor subunit TctC